MKPLLYLDLLQLKNLIKITLRSPKRLIPIILIGAWLALIIIPQRLTGNSNPYNNMPMNGIFIFNSVWTVVFLFLSMLTLQAIYKSFSDSSLVFSLPEIDTIFPAPIGKKQVMALKLIKTYIRSAVYLLFFMVLLYPSIRLIGRFGGDFNLASIWLSVLIYSILLTNVCIIINLISSYRDNRKWQPAVTVKITAYTFYVLIAAGIVFRYLHAGNLVDAMASTLTNPVFTTVMLPVKWTTDLAFTPIHEWFTGKFIETVLLVLLTISSFLLLLSRDENPYEPSLNISTRFAAMRTAWRSGNWSKAKGEMLKSKGMKLNASYGFRPFGRGAVSIIWKNINLMVRSSLKGWIFILVIIAAGLLIAKSSDTINSVAINRIAPFGIGYLLLIGSGIMSHSFRSDMKQANILKPIPISSWKLVAAEPVHGVIAVTIMIWLMVGMISAIFGIQPGSPLILTAMCMPFLAYSCLSTQVAAVVLYPNWDDITQRYLGQMASGFASMFGALLPIGIGALLWYLKMPVLLITGIICLICAGFSIAGIALGTAAYKRFDPTDE